MANSLTGNYEAVFQIGVAQINYMLATMHQNKIDRSAYGLPSFEHSAGPVDIRPSTRFKPGFGVLTRWLGDEAAKLHSDLSTLIRITDPSPKRSERGDPHAQPLSIPLQTGLAEVDKLIKETIGDWKVGVVGQIPHGAVSGSAYVQLSPPWISFAGGATSTVKVHVNIRAAYYPDTGTPPLPEPVHGRVDALYTLQVLQGKMAVHVEVSKNDNDITFNPASGTVSAAEAQTIAKYVRTALRQQFVAHDVAVPGNFPFSEFLAIDGGSTIALPFQPSGAPLPGGSLFSATQLFLGGADFAVALGQEYAQGLLQPMLDSMTNAVNGMTFNISFKVDVGFWSTQVEVATYHASLTYLNATWKPGGIDISGKIHLHTNSVFPDYDLEFTQTLTVVLDVASQTLSIQPVGGTTVTGPSFLVNMAATDITKQRDAALITASSALQAKFSEVRGRFQAGLDAFDHHAASGFRFTSVEVTPDGLILRGELGHAGRTDPIVSYSAVGDGSVYSAFQSWVPGGRIHKFNWSWAEGPVFRSQVKFASETHRYLLPTPPAVAGGARICLSVEGSRLRPDGSDEAVSGGGSCHVRWHEPILEVPGWLVKILLPLWAPDPPQERPLEDAIVGHINVAGQSQSPQGLTSNYLVHFVGEDLPEQLTGLNAATEAQHGNGAFVMVLVFPKGSFRKPAREIGSVLAAFGERLGSRLVLTEDYLGGWTTAFSAAPSSSYLINAHRRLAWKQEGRVDPRAITQAMAKYLVSAPAPDSVLMELTVRVGDPVLDLRLVDELGDTIALHRMIGRRIAINFWQSWSTPCLRELRRLQELHKSTGTIVLAVNGGERRERLTQIQREHDLKLRLIPDPDYVITSRYGVQCWPTTIYVNAAGTIERIQFGLSHEAREGVTRA
jgi:peroxiredoxin